MDVICGSGAVSDATSIPPRPIVHIGIVDCSRDGLSKVATFKKSLKCLDVNIGVTEWHPKVDSDKEIENDAGNGDKPANPVHDTLKDLLLQIPNLQELGFDLETGNTYISTGVGGKFDHPERIGEKDLVG